MSELSFGPFINKYLSLIHEQFKNIPETNNGRTNNISLTDSLMSGLAIFALKFPSLLQFEEAKLADPTLLHISDCVPKLSFLQITIGLNCLSA